MTHWRHGCAHRAPPRAASVRSRWWRPPESGRDTRPRVLSVGAVGLPSLLRVPRRTPPSPPEIRGDPTHIDGRSEKVPGSELRALNVRPDPQRLLPDRTGCHGGHPVLRDEEATEQLHVEQPTGQERLPQRRLERRSAPEDLRSALRIVDGGAEGERRRRGEDTSKIVPDRPSLNVPAEQRDPRA